MGKLKLFDGTQFIILDSFPRKGTVSFTTLTVAGSGGIRTNDEAFNNRSLIRKLTVTPAQPAVNSFVIEFFKSGSFSAGKLEYKATASGTFVDNDVWFHEDEDQVSEVHLKLTNNSIADSTFTVELSAEEFS